MLAKSKSLSALMAGAAVFASLAYANFRADRARADAAVACCKFGKSNEAGTLDPALFTGPAREAYKLAGKNPSLFSQLHCYCGCDLTYGHKSLLDCYRDGHGARCEICVGEALQANTLANQNTPVEQIREALRERYAPSGG
jgi:hypothetical protein